MFLALLRRYGLKPYRYRGQRYTTVMVKVSKRFVDDTLWPEFGRIAETLRSYLSEFTDRVVSEVIDKDMSEAAVVQQGGALLPAVAPSTSASNTSTPPTAAAEAEPAASPPTRADGGPTSGAGSNRANKQKRKQRRKRRK